MSSAARYRPGVDARAVVVAGRPKTAMRLADVANRLACELEGPGDLELTGVATLEQAEEGDLSFLANSKYSSQARRTKASAIIVSSDCPPLECALLRHHNPYLTFARAIELFHAPAPRAVGIHPTACVADSAVIGGDVSIGPFAVVDEGVVVEGGASIGAHVVVHSRGRIGAGAVIHSGAVIRERVEIGPGCIIQSNAVVGADGFGYAKNDDGSWYRILPAGSVVLGENVEVGAGTTIDRATLGNTIIRAGAKLDNLVQIGHSCTVGEDSLLCAQVGLAGSTNIGRRVILAGQVGSAGHLTVGDDVMATGQTGIPGSVEAGTVISGSPAIDNRRWLRSTAAFAKLPELRKHVQELRSRLTLVEEALETLKREG